MRRVALATAVLCVLVGSGAAHAATLQQVGVFAQPMYVTSAPADPDRLFVAERSGRIREVRDGVVSTFADISAEIGSVGPSTEQGLLSIALAPNFALSGRLYVFYAGAGTGGDIHIAEMRASGGTAPSSSLRDLLVIEHPGETNHYGGQLQFGIDGNLYISIGDGGGQDDEHHNAQSLAKLLGKILRIDPQPSGLLPYTVPAGNPYPGLGAPFDTIWSSGLRNPYRFSFDRQNGAMLIGDVGQGALEEVDYAVPGGGAGANYGWNCFEGKLPGPATDPECTPPPPPGTYTDPIFEYPHDDPGGGAATGCAIVGGYVARDPSLGDLFGRYLYGDYCEGELRSFSLANPAATDRSEGLLVPEMTSFGEDSCGRLYVASRAGRVSRLVGGPDACPKTTPRSVSFIGIKAQNGRVKRHRRALITAFVSPCAGRRGEPVKLFRGRQHLGTRHLDRACSVRFRPKITRKANFRAVIGEDANYVAATSRQLRIKILQPKRNQRR